jgi:hypothetical protein
LPAKYTERGAVTHAGAAIVADAVLCLASRAAGPK